MHKNLKKYLTERVAALIREGKTLPWQMPYQKATRPMNPISGTQYRGANRFLLSLLCELQDLSPLFLTYRQAAGLES